MRNNLKKVKLLAFLPSTADWYISRSTSLFINVILLLEEKLWLFKCNINARMRRREQPGTWYIFCSISSKRLQKNIFINFITRVIHDGTSYSVSYIPFHSNFVLKMTATSVDKNLNITYWIICPTKRQSNFAMLNDLPQTHLTTSLRHPWQTKTHKCSKFNRLKRKISNK